jgi:lipopolysaccharide export LptBFGC system permease protein LptF
MSDESVIPLVMTLSILLPVIVLLAIALSSRLRDHGQLASILAFAALAFNVLSWINGLSSTCRINESECIGATAAAFLFVVPALLAAFWSTGLILRHHSFRQSAKPNQQVATDI